MIGVITVGIFYLCNFVICSLAESSQTLKQFSARSAGGKTYTLSDNYKGASEQSLMDDVYQINSLKEFYSGLQNWDGGDYFLFSSPGLMLKADEKSSVTPMRIGYEDGMMFDECDNDMEHLVSVKQISLNKAACDYLALTLAEGRLFEDGDYIYYKGYIPVLLGNEYSGLYQAGDTITAEFYTVRRPLKVIGILEEGEYLVLNDHTVTLDRYVVTPAQIFPKEPSDSQELFLQAAVSLDNVNGQMRLHEGITLRDLLMFLESYQEKYGIEPIDLLEVPTHAIETMRAINDRNLPIFTAVTALLIIYAIMAIHFTLKSVVEKDRQYYAVNLVCGKGLGRLVFDLFARLFALFIIAHLLAAGLTSFSTNHQMQYSFLWIMVSILVFISVYTIQRHLCKMPVWEIIGNES